MSMAVSSPISANSLSNHHFIYTGRRAAAFRPVYISMNKVMNYSVEEKSVALSADEYICRFRDADRFMERCRECDNYSCSWACPPFVHDVETELRQYVNVIITATKLIPERKDIPISEVFGFMHQERVRLDRMMLDMERRYGGRYFAFSGTCLYCPEGTCARMSGLPCRHPEFVRPSLEACGFDMGRTVTELFGWEIKWSSDGFLPEYLTIVSGFFHNDDRLDYSDLPPV